MNWISFFNPIDVSKHHSQFNRLFTKPRELLLKEGIDVYKDCPYEVMRYLFILLNEQSLDQLKIDELNIEDKAELFYYCVKYCDLNVGNSFLINRFMELTKNMEWNFNEEFYFRGVNTFLCMSLQHFPTKSETQISLLKECLNFLIGKNVNPALEFIFEENVIVETLVYPYDRTVPLPRRRITPTTVNQWLEEKSIPQRTSDDPIYQIADDVLKSRSHRPGIVI